MECFFFKQKTAYEMRISDWSSDVCSSDLVDDRVLLQVGFYDVPHGRAFGALVHGRPAGDHVVARRVDRLARCQQGHFGDARADRLPRVDAVAHATDPHHVAALLVVGIGIEEGVGAIRSEEHRSELQALMRRAYADFVLKKTTHKP